MKTQETRFFQRKVFVIDTDTFTNVMQELLDDSSLEICKDYSNLVMYSRGHDVDVGEEEILQRIGDHLGVCLRKCLVDPYEDEIFFVAHSYEK